MHGRHALELRLCELRRAEYGAYDQRTADQRVRGGHHDFLCS